MKKPIVVAVIPAYNEEKRIQTVLQNITSYVSKIIVVDDGSTDNTFSKSIGKKVITISHMCNLGQGAALQTGFEYAKNLGADIVITFDADGQFSAKDIPIIVNPILRNEADIVLGSRFLGSVENISFIKILILKLGILFTYIFSSIKLSDTHNGFRAFNKRALANITLTQNGMAHASEIIDLIKYHNLRYVEVPVTVTYDRYTKKKGQRYSNIFNIILNLLFNKLH